MERQEGFGLFSCLEPQASLDSACPAVDRLTLVFPLGPRGRLPTDHEKRAGRTTCSRPFFLRSKQVGPSVLPKGTKDMSRNQNVERAAWQTSFCCESELPGPCSPRSAPAETKPCRPDLLRFYTEVASPRGGVRCTGKVIRLIF